MEQKKSRINLNFNKSSMIMSAVAIAMAVGIIVIICFLQLLPFWAKTLAIVLSAVLGVACVVFNHLGFLKTYKLIFIGISLVLLVAVLYLLLEATGFMSIFNVAEGVEDKNQAIENNLKEYLETKGQWAMPVFVVLQFLQTFILPIPSFLVTAVGTLLYGVGLGGLLSLIGILIGSFLGFIVGRMFGYKLVAWIVGKEALIAMLKKLKGKDIAVLSLMFLLPFFPDDILCFIAGLSTMNMGYFIFIITFSRVITVFSTAALVDIIPFTEIWGLAVWAVLIVLTLIAFYFAVKKGEQIENFIRYKVLRLKKKEGIVGDFAQKILDSIKDDEDKAKTKIMQKQQKLCLMEVGDVDVQGLSVNDNTNENVDPDKKE